MTPDIALAASAREWPDRLHRHLLDHGGGRVTTRVMGSDQAAAGGFDVLLIDDISSFLTPRLVTVVKRDGAHVVGVFDSSDGSDAKRRLLECGISDVIESDASVEEFLVKIDSSLAHRQETSRQEGTGDSRAWSIGVMGTTDGVGVTEVAVGLASALSDKLPTTLIDLDPVWPSIAPRLDLALHPNLRTAVDEVLHQSGELSKVSHSLGSLSVIGGVADHGSAAPMSHTEAAMVLDAVAASTGVLVADLGSLNNVLGGVIPVFGSVALVGAGDPVGVSRLMKAVDRMLGLIEEEVLVVVVNKIIGGAYQEAEIRNALAGAFPRVPTLLMPFDRRVADSMWQGSVANRGRFTRSMRRMTQLIEETVWR